MANTTKDGKVYNSNGQYLGGADIVYGTGPIGKQKNKGITTGLDSSATENSQPSGMFNADNNRIPGADPKTPSTNSATRREKYNIQNGTPSYDVGASSDIPTYYTDPTMGGQYHQPKTTTPQEQTGPRTLGSYYSDLGGQEAMDQINAIFNEKGINTASEYFQETYGEAATTALNNAMQTQIDLGKAITDKRGFLGHTSTNADRVQKLSEEVYKAVSYNALHGITNDINEIAKNTGATPEEVQAILTGDAYRLIELTDEYKNREFREFYRRGEDLTLDMQYNRQTFQNSKNNLDYQFNSAMDKIQRSLFDSERTAKETAGIYGMTGTNYTLNRIKKEYEQQINDVTNTYQYQSAQAQLNINYALENYGNAMIRLNEDLDYYTQDAQKLALQEMTNLNNAVGLSFTQQKQILLQLQSDINRIKSEGLQSALTQLEAGNKTLAEQIANAYGIDISGLSSVTTTGGGTYTPTNQSTVDGALYSITSSTNYTNGKKIRSGSCGTIVNDYLGMLGSGIHIKYASDMEKYINYRGTDPMVGSIVYFAPGSLEGMSEDGKKYGHVAVVTGVNKEKGTITVRESNENTGIRDHEYKMSDVAGYFNPQEGYESTSFTDDELTAAKNIYDADMDMLDTVERFKEAYGEVENMLDMDIMDIPGSVFSNVLKVQMKANGVETVGDLFYHATNAESSYYDEATNLLRQLDNPKLNQAAKLLRQITNKTFIQQLITAKGQGATFGNLTEGEGRRIETAYNEISGALDYESMMNGVDYLISNIVNDLTYMDKLYGNNLNPKRKYGQNVEPTPTTETDTLSYIEDTYGSGVVISPL